MAWPVVAQQPPNVSEHPVRPVLFPDGIKGKNVNISQVPGCGNALCHPMVLHMPTAGAEIQLPLPVLLGMTTRGWKEGQKSRFPAPCSGTCPLLAQCPSVQLHPRGHVTMRTGALHAAESSMLKAGSPPGALSAPVSSSLPR